MDPTNPTGIVYTSSGQTTFLPLEKVEVKVLIVDVSARVTLRQTYINPTNTVTSRCKYMFPVPASAGICAFNMETSDGRILRGEAKDKDIARKEYEDALQAGQLAGLVNHATDDIFTISIGSISANASVNIDLEYVMNLSNDDNADEVRFQLSSGVGERYGTPPDELSSALRPTDRTRIRITCEIQTSGRIKDIVSPSHAAEISEARYSTTGGRLSRRRSTIKYRSASFLDRDFVLIIGANGLDSPRCFAELHEDSQRQKSLALQLTLVPKLCLPPIEAQEYLFVVDRSGSMSGSRMMIAKKTLSLLLRMLPASRTVFNVYIFDNDVESFSPCSLEYNEKSLSEASAFVDRIEARGGTEIGQALRQVLGTRSRSVPTAVFVLTDGEVYGDDAIQVVKEAVVQAPESAPLRVFTLGIGSQVSTATCEGIAAAGNGVFLYATEAENILGKCARLFRAGRTPIVNEVTIDWGLSSEHLGSQGSVTFLNQTLSPRTVAVLPPPTIQQAPTKVHSLHAGTQMIVSAIVQLKKFSVPATITVRGVFDNGGTFLLPVPVGAVYLDGANKGLPLIHTLTARLLIQEHEEKRANLPSSLLPASEDDIRRAVIVSLGVKYQLVSRYTSFVAVDAGQDDRRRPRYQPSPRNSPREQTPDESPARQGPFSLLQTAFNLLSGLLGTEVSPRLEDAETVPGSWPVSPPSNDGTEGNDDGAESDGSADSKETFSTMSSLNSCDCSDESAPSSPRLRPQLTAEEEERQRQQSPRIEPIALLPNQVPLQRREPPSTPLGAAVIQLVRLQSYDGSYSLENLRHVAGIGSAVDEVNNLGVTDKIWATALSVAFMEKEMVGQRELVRDLLAKAIDYLKDKSEVDLAELLQSARDALAHPA
ncbi:hypothetical protein DXG01_004216 [Tephrocybe rancida]|nr:hypothetical protein DXG01_004216 [Tephrocybe rancida]